jgi:hypothetical protein
MALEDKADADYYDNINSENRIIEACEIDCIGAHSGRGGGKEKTSGDLRENYNVLLRTNAFRLSIKNF